jgi:hypothetical protein
MNIGADEKKHIARLLNFFLSGEKVPHRFSPRQPKLSKHDQVKRFLIRQSRQERFHAVTFQSAILWLSPKGVCVPANKTMQQYESLLNEATDNHDLFSSVIGLQVILEGMGDIALSHFDDGMRQRGLGYQKLRRAILAQEDMHHEFGLSYFYKNTPPAVPAVQSDNYLSLVDDMLTSLQGLFDFFDEDSGSYMAEFKQSIPQQIHNNALSHHTRI